MKIFYDETHRLHNPPFEIFEGGQRVPYLESPERMDRILAALSKMAWAEICKPRDFGLDPIRAVHSDAYLTFLASAWSEWQSAQTQSASSSEPVPLLPATFAAKRGCLPESVLGKAGFFMFDLSVPLLEGTYSAALAAAHCALSAAEYVTSSGIEGPQAAFALCRPPGHHAGRDAAGGYCYLNNAAIAAQWLTRFGKVAILDVDYHAGNGTQDIFYTRSDVLTISIHADPSFEYPYYSGYAQETGEGQGIGFHYNFPLPAGADDTTYLQTLDRALAIADEFRPAHLVISLGMDIYENDPLGLFKITSHGIGEIGRRVHALGLPTLIVMEGGYNTDMLGANIATFLETCRF